MIFGGIGLCIYVTDSREFLLNSLSYLGTDAGVPVVFTILLVSLSLVHGVYLWTIVRRIFCYTSALYARISVIAAGICYAVAMVLMFVAGLVSYDYSFYVHWIAGIGMFVLYLLGGVFLSIGIYSQNQLYGRISIALMLLFEVMTAVALYNAIGVAVPEAVGLLIGGFWNVSLLLMMRRIFAKEH